MARILKLKNAGEDGCFILVNTTQVVLVEDQDETTAIFYSDGNESVVANSFESILRAWRYGNTQGETEVFDVP